MTNLEIVKKLITNKGIIEVSGKKHEIGYTYLNHLLTDEVITQLNEIEKKFINKFSQYLIFKTKTPWNIKTKFEY